MDRKNRTWLCSVLFLDIVGYSKLSVSRQMQIKQHFSEVVADAIKDFQKDDCINLDTGDGIAICFLGDPEELLFMAIGLRDIFEEMATSDNGIKYGVRLGINLGPVKIIEDINGQRNTIGDGINVAQRIMDFATPNQLLVSRSYYEVVSCLSDSHVKMFSYLGLRKDKHVRQHEVYEVASHRSETSPEEHLNRDALEAVFYPEPAQTLAPDAATAGFTDELLGKITEQLAVHVGPMAKILVKKAVKKANSIETLYQMLAGDIPSGDERRQFLDSMKS
jgi:class 3 adenylate cyclase